MANLIDSSYFVGEREIPNTTNASVLARLNWFITKYEPEFLENLLGYPLYKAWVADNNTTQKYKDITDGVEYEDDNGVTQKWHGLRNATTKTSMIADNIYYYFMKDAIEKNTGFGVVMQKADGAVNISPATKMCAAWNSMSRQVGDLVNYLLSQSRSSDYPEFTSINAACSLWLFSRINEFGI